MEIDQRKLENNIWKLYLYETLYSLMFYTPIIVLFYQSNGLKLTQIMILQSISSIVWILAEIPTGHFADVIGRKNSLLMTGIFATLAMTVYALGNNFYYFLFAVLFWALAGAFISGADSAFMYDNLKELGREKSYKKIWGNAIFFYSVGIAVASIAGGFLGGLNLRYPFYAMIPFYLLLIFVALSFYEPRHDRDLTRKNSILSSFGLINKTIIHNKKIRWLLIYSAIITSAIGVSYWLYQPYLKLSGLSIVYYGLVFASFNLVSAVSAKYSHIIEEKLGRKASLASLFILTSLGYLLMGKIIFIFSFVFAQIFQFVSGFSSVVISDYIHKETDSSVRATTFSVKSFIEHIFYAAIAPLVGWMVDVYTLPQALMVMGMIVGVVGLFFISVGMLSPKRHNI